MKKSKVCRRCKKRKDINSFYVHKHMGDGHLNICIGCVTRSSRNRYKVLAEDLDWLESERARGREKGKRLYKGVQTKNHTANVRKWRAKYPEKWRASRASKNIVIPFGFNHRHHWSYNERHFKDVIFLNHSDHALVHRNMIYDHKEFLYRRKDNGVLLNTRSKHEKFITLCISKRSNLNP